jgi:hypothetical protein
MNDEATGLPEPRRVERQPAATAGARYAAIGDDNVSGGTGTG